MWCRLFGHDWYTQSNRISLDDSALGPIGFEAGQCRRRHCFDWARRITWKGGASKWEFWKH